MKRVLITGASSGIGRATALELAGHGAWLVLSGRREDALAEVAAECEHLGGTAEFVAGSLEDDRVRARLIETSFGNLEAESDPVLINNAGIGEFGPFHTLSPAQITAQLETNLMAPLWLCHAAIPRMLKAGGGQIINVLSVTTHTVFAGTSAYSAAKAGLNMLGQVLSAEYRRQGIRVTQVFPGAVDTPIWDGKSFVPPKKDMLPVAAVAECLRDLVMMPKDRTVDEIRLMPPKGVL